MSNSDKLLIAGPWVGEFGWELFAWQAYVRALSHHFEQTLILCRETSEALYKDFATDFLFIDSQTGWVDSFFMHGVDANQLLRETLMNRRPQFLKQSPTIFTPRRIGWPPRTHYTESFKLGDYDIVPEYITYGQQTTTQYDYVFHLRHRELRKEDNWDIRKWEKLLELLSISPEKVACVGTYNEALHLEGTKDLRGADTSDVLTVIRNAKCTFGPSSGPMHLASLCACPHVVWSRPENDVRYHQTWNPLNTPVLFLSEFGCHPSPDYVFEKFNNWI